MSKQAMTDSSDDEKEKEWTEKDENLSRKPASRTTTSRKHAANGDCMTSDGDSVHSSDPESAVSKGHYKRRSKKPKVRVLELMVLPDPATKTVTKKQFNDLLAITSDYDQQLRAMTQDAARSDALEVENSTLKQSLVAKRQEVIANKESNRSLKDTIKSLKDLISNSGGGASIQKKLNEAVLKAATEELARKNLEEQKREWMKKEVDLKRDNKRLEKENMKLHEKDRDSLRAIEEEKTRQSEMKLKSKRHTKASLLL